MPYRILIVLGTLFLWSAFKQQKLDTFIGKTFNSPRELKSSMLNDLDAFRVTEAGVLFRIKTLVESGSIHSRNRFGSTPLLLAACQNGDMNVVEYLYSHGARLYEGDSFGTTPLMCAAESGNLLLVTWLLKKGVPINQRNRLGQTALFLAAKEGRYRTVQTLLNSGAATHLKDLLGRTPEHLAVKNRYLRVANLLKPKTAKSRIFVRATY